MRRHRSFQFVESSGPEILETQGYDRVREKHPEGAKDEDEMDRPAPLPSGWRSNPARERNTRDGDRSQ